MHFSIDSRKASHSSSVGVDPPSSSPCLGCSCCWASVRVSSSAVSSAADLVGLRPTAPSPGFFCPIQWSSVQMGLRWSSETLRHTLTLRKTDDSHFPGLSPCNGISRNINWYTHLWRKDPLLIYLTDSGSRFLESLHRWKAEPSTHPSPNSVKWNMFAWTYMAFLHCTSKNQTHK